MIDADAHAPEEVMWEGKYVRALRRGRWEYAGRTNGVRAVVILAKDQENIVLVEQYRVAIGTRSLELPAGLIGDGSGPQEDAEEAARRELEEETGFRPGKIETLGEFYSSPGMLSESFTLVRASELIRVGPGGGVAGEEEIEVHCIPQQDLSDFISEKRRSGVAIDVRMLLLLGSEILALS